jgi:histidinol dehydrogenase
VRDGGDRVLRELVARFDLGGAPAPPALRLAPEELDVTLLADDVRAGLEVAITNVALVADAAVGEDTEVTLPQGQRVVLREVPVRRAAIYVPGAQAPYPSALVMGVVTARAAGVEEVAVLTAPPIDPVIRGTCALCGVHEVHAMGGAHGIAALAYGTESIGRVDKIVGPGGAYVNEAKLAVSREVAIDLPAGPSEVVVVVGNGADRRAAELELAAQAEHGPDTVCRLIEADGDAEAALGEAEQLAPEHLVLLGDEVEALAGRVRNAGAVFVGPASSVAAGDYATGGNHVLPTAGWARAVGGLGLETFLKPVTVQRITPEGLATLRPVVEALADVEGMPAHAEAVRR